jgi:2-polyprenyl-3-methyl-5-hydroxy-6-metoxy-1,4-benzoquinol methylase
MASGKNCGRKHEGGRIVMDNDKKNWDMVRELVDNDKSTFEIGKYFSHEINVDIKHLLFTLSRYKFASKLLKYKSNIRMLELGCSEAWGGMLFKQNLDIERYVGVDLDDDAINWNKTYLSDGMDFICGNFFENETLVKFNDIKYDAICSLDVIEHINPDAEDAYCKVLYDNLKEDGVAIIGTPNIEMKPYASEESRRGHINLYNQKRLYELMSKYFNNVFIFNMNDEVVNTGFEPMACYIFAVCCNKKR